MTPDQLRHEEARAWLDRARRDLRAARLLIAGEASAEALFHCQQAVERALKAFLTFHQRIFENARSRRLESRMPRHRRVAATGCLSS